MTKKGIELTRLTTVPMRPPEHPPGYNNSPKPRGGDNTSKDRNDKGKHKKKK